MEAAVRAAVGQGVAEQSRRLRLEGLPAAVAAVLRRAGVGVDAAVVGPQVVVGLQAGAVGGRRVRVEINPFSNPFSNPVSN
jgi:hypothetical protein